VADIKTIDRCRVCGGTELVSVLSLEKQFLTGVFPKSKEQRVTSGPVDLVRCVARAGCGLTQLKQCYDVGEMYGENYGYRSGLNASMVRHLQDKVAKILSMGVLSRGDAIIDIGSNDATTLKAYPQSQYDLFGVDPSGEKFRSHYPPQIGFVPDFFSAKAIRGFLGNRKAKVVTSFSMYYDLEDPVAFAAEVAQSLDEDGIWVLEQSYLPTMLSTNSFDTVCHEHMEYYCLTQIKWIAEKVGLKVIDVEFNDVNGGSFSVVVAKQASARRTATPAVAAVLEREATEKPDSLEAFAAFAARVKAAGVALRDFLVSAKRNGKRVVGLGASTKGNVLLQHYGIGPELLSVIAEVNPDKFGSWTPGTLIPIESEAEVLSTEPDYLLVLPWHFRRFFVRHASYKGRTLVFPLPQLELVTV
jgi:NDP-4-keto-2,6-dideoxyhexose 3-C-methyltransferase